MQRNFTSLDVRARGHEWMDDLDPSDPRLRAALDELRTVNALLGGSAATRRVLAPYLAARRGRRVRMLDVGTGAADVPEAILRWAVAGGADLEIVAVDANPAVVDYARDDLDRRLPMPLRSRIHVRVGDALALDAEDGAFDVSTAALFLHHFADDDAAAVLREMDRVARDGILVNDLHRHRVAYAGIVAIAHVLSRSEMFRHDGPLSVRRGFRRAELAALAAEAGLEGARIRWHWAFRWTLSTLRGYGGHA